MARGNAGGRRGGGLRRTGRRRGGELRTLENEEDVITKKLAARIVQAPQRVRSEHQKRKCRRYRNVEVPATNQTASANQSRPGGKSSGVSEWDDSGREREVASGDGAMQVYNVCRGG